MLTKIKCRLEQCLTEFQLAVVDKHWKGIFSAATIAERAVFHLFLLKNWIGLQSIYLLAFVDY
jgi:hypothetical protein